MSRNCLLTFGRFLWVYFQLEELCDATSDTHIREILRDLPKGLGETYGRILEKLGNSNNKFPPKVFRWIACAQRPLHLGELQEAVNHEVTDRSWHDAADIDGDRLIRSCGALVCIDEDEQTVRFAHHTVLQFLLSPGKILSYHFSLVEANRHVGEIRVVYLCFSDFETAITRRLPDHSIGDAPVFQTGGVAGIPSSLGIGKLLSNVVRFFHAGKSDSQMDRVDIDYERYMGLSQKPMEPVVPALAKKYLLLDYVVANWDWHAKSLEESSSVIWNSFRRLAMHKELAFDFRRWGINEHYGGPYGCVDCDAKISKTYSEDLPFMSLINYAVSVGHVPMLRLFEAEPDGILSLSAYFKHQGPYKVLFYEGHYQALSLACYNERKDCVKFLIDEFPDHYTPAEVMKEAAYCGQEAIWRMVLSEYPQDQLDGVRSALRSAIKGGQDAILKFLLDEGAPFNTQVDKILNHVALDKDHDALIATLIKKGLLPRHDLARDGGSPLHLAAGHGISLTVQALLQAGESVDTRYEQHDCTALHEAAYFGHSNVIEVLLDHKANIEARSSMQWTALHKAALYGHVDAVRMLCQRGANIEAGIPEHQVTPLHYAVRNGNVAVIRELVKWGADLNAPLIEGDTPLDYAIKHRRKVAQAVLRELGAKTGAELRGE